MIYERLFVSGMEYTNGICKTNDAENYLKATVQPLKGRVSQDFLLLVFFMNQFPPSSRVFHLDRFEFFRKFAEIFASQGAPLVSTTPVENWPPVSTTPAANLPPVSKRKHGIIFVLQAVYVELGKQRPLYKLTDDHYTPGTLC